MRRGKAETTLYVIAYDIPSNRRRTKVHKTLSGVGSWTQFSLFECFLTDKEMLTLRDKLDTILDASKDSVRFYPLCVNCKDKVDTIGSEKPAEATMLLI